MIKEIEATRIVGNAYHDMPLMMKIHKFMRDDHPMSEKVRALRKLDMVKVLKSF